MSYFQAFLMTVGAVSLIGSIFFIILGYSISRNSLDRFNNPNEPRLVKIRRLPWCK